MEIDTELEVQVQSGYELKMKIVDSLASQGVILACQKEEPNETVKLTIINSGRAIVVLNEGDPLAEVKLEKIVKLEWAEK